MPTVTEILLTIAKEFGFAAAESLLTLLENALHKYEPAAAYNHNPPQVIAHIQAWKEERGVNS